MSETDWTPGPWGFGNTSDDQRLVLGKSGSGRYVCNVQIHQTPRHMGQFDETEREANARLISAAPDLYEAATEARLQIEYLHDKFQPTSTGEAVLARLRAALSKASARP